MAAAQIHSGGSGEDILRRVECQVAAAAAVGADVILFAECALHGYDGDMTFESIRAIAEPVSGPRCRRILEMAERYRITVLVGFFEKDGNFLHNSVLVARPDGTVKVARKFALTPTELEAGLTPGPRERLVVELNGVRCAILICADVGIEGLREDLRNQGVEYWFGPTGGGGKITDMLHAVDLLTPEGQARYIESRARVFNNRAILDMNESPLGGFTSANALGPVGRRTCHQGHCMIVDNQRVMRAQISGTTVLEHM